MNRQTFIYEGNQFKIAESGDFIRVVKIVEKQGTTKLKDPILHIEYYGKDKKGFTTYMEEAKRLVKNDRWLKVKI